MPTGRLKCVIYFPNIFYVFTVINFEQGLKAEALASALRLYCVVSNLHEDARIIWYQDDIEISEEHEDYKVGLKVCFQLLYY